MLGLRVCQERTFFNLQNQQTKAISTTGWGCRWSSGFKKLYIPFSSKNVLLQLVPACQKGSMCAITVYDSANIIFNSNNKINFAA